VAAARFVLVRSSRGWPERRGAGRGTAEPAGLTIRLISASLAAAVLARCETRSPIPAVVIASAAALAVAKIGRDVPREL